MEAVNGLLSAGVYLRYGGGLDFVILSTVVSAPIDLERELILSSIIFPSVVLLLAIVASWSGLLVSRPSLGN